MLYTFLFCETKQEKTVIAGDWGGSFSALEGSVGFHNQIRMMQYGLREAI